MWSRLSRRGSLSPAFFRNEASSRLGEVHLLLAALVAAALGPVLGVGEDDSEGVVLSDLQVATLRLRATSLWGEFSSMPVLRHQLHARLHRRGSSCGCPRASLLGVVCTDRNMEGAWRWERAPRWRASSKARARRLGEVGATRPPPTMRRGEAEFPPIDDALTGTFWWPVDEGLGLLRDGPCCNVWSSRFLGKTRISAQPRISCVAFRSCLKPLVCSCYL
jgi:hypothetical protein